MSSQFIKSFFPALVAISGRISMFRDDLIPRTEIDVLIEMMQCSKQPHCPKPPIRTNTPHNSVGGGLDNLNEIAYEKEQQWRGMFIFQSIHYIMYAPYHRNVPLNHIFYLICFIQTRCYKLREKGKCMTIGGKQPNELRRSGVPHKNKQMKL